MGKLAIFGTSGFSKEVLDIAINQGYTEIVFLTHDESIQGKIFDFPIVHENQIPTLVESSFKFAIATGEGSLRKKIHSKYPHLEYPNLIHSSTTFGFQMDHIFSEVQGLIFAAGVRITTDCKFGNFIVLNLNVTIGHDSQIDDFVSVMPGANISGNVHLCTESYIGTGATVLQGKDEFNKMLIGKQSVVGAGSVVVKKVAEKVTVVGIPARELQHG